MTHDENAWQIPRWEGALPHSTEDGVPSNPPAMTIAVVPAAAAAAVIAERDRSEVQGMSSGTGTIRGFFLRGGAMRRVWESLREVLDRDDPPRAIDIQSPTL